MDIHDLFAFAGFMLAAYSVVGNDSVQTLGTFIASNIRVIKWYWLWLAASTVLVLTLGYGWVTHGGDMSYGRLNKIPYREIEWYHAAAPLVLVLLTRFGMPVSTTFLILSVFASTVVLQDILIKSVVGYGVAAVSSYIIWLVLSRFINEKFNLVKREHRMHWRVLQWLSTGFLWCTWLMHDLANVAVYLPRQVDLPVFAGALAVLVFWLAVIFKTGGGKIQKVILEKTGSRFMRSATIIDFVYAVILLFFKELNDLPMSTTWVFVGVLCGRELAIASTVKSYRLGYVFPLIGKDFLKMLFGLSISIAMVLAIHYFIDGAGLQ